MNISEKHHLILVTTWYPPRHSVAVNRMLAFAKYIDKTVFDVDVVTLSCDEKLEKDVDFKGVTVYRLPNNVLFRRARFDKPVPYVFHKMKALYNIILSLFVKREFRDWQKRAEEKVAQLLKKYGETTTVITSYEPIEPHLVAIALKKRGFQFHWVADCRDEISSNPSVIRSLRKLYADAELQMLSCADMLTTVSNPILEDFQNKIPSPKPAFLEIRNGYDFEIKDDDSENERFTLSFVGTFYGKIKPDTFFSGLQLFLADNPEAKVKVDLIGVGHTVVVPHELSGVVETFARIPHSDAIERMRTSDGLLLILPKTERKGVYSGKLFEYLGLHKPILAVVDPEDVAAELIQECNAGYIADFDDITSIKKGIETLYQHWKNGDVWVMNEEVIKQHHRREQVMRLNEQIINEFYHL